MTGLQQGQEHPVALPQGKIHHLTYRNPLQDAFGALRERDIVRVRSVKKGQFIMQGDTIGLIGNTGKSTGPHLHYEVHIGSDVVDPAKYVNVVLTK